MQEKLQQVFSDDTEAQYKGLVELRRLVCATKNTPYECGAVIRAGLVPKVHAFSPSLSPSLTPFVPPSPIPFPSFPLQIITFLDHAEPRLQVEAAWLLTNLSSGAFSFCPSFLPPSFNSATTRVPLILLSSFLAP
jgi:hypothetical protein